MTERDVEGRIAVVTGGSLGMGRAAPRRAADIWKGEQASEAIVEAWGKMHPIGVTLPES